MIRPVTFLSFLLACAAGYYLFQSKHQAQVLRQEIDGAVRTADAARARTAELRAEWALLNDPLRLQRLAHQFLDLKPMRPGQFLTLAQLARRLPAPGSAPPAGAPPAASPGLAVAAVPAATAPPVAGAVVIPPAGAPVPGSGSGAGAAVAVAAVVPPAPAAPLAPPAPAPVALLPAPVRQRVVGAPVVKVTTPALAVGRAAPVAAPAAVAPAPPAPGLASPSAPGSALMPISLAPPVPLGHGGGAP